MIKAVFFDIDGTLVSFHTHRVSEATRQAIRQLRTQGIKVFIATGRHLQVINNLGDLEFDGYVTLNGSCCYIGRDRVIYRRMIPEIALEHLIKYQEEKETFPCIFVREKDMFINYNNQHTREVFRMLDFPEPVVKDIHEATREGVFQLIAFFSEQQEDRIMQALPECEATRWNRCLPMSCRLGETRVSEWKKYWLISEFPAKRRWLSGMEEMTFLCWNMPE